MVSVALFRPVWWMACRSVRFVTALVLMALLLGAGAARPTPTLTAPPDATGGASVVAEHRSDVAGRVVAPDRAPATVVADPGTGSVDGPTYVGRAGSGDGPTYVSRTGSGDGPTYVSRTGSGDGPTYVSRAGAGERTGTAGVVAPVAAVEPVAPASLRDPSAGLPGTGSTTSPTGDAYPRTSGSRAPPVG